MAERQQSLIRGQRSLDWLFKFMFDFLPFILIIVSLAVMIVIIARKFPQLSLLDVKNIPEVQVENKKNVLLKKRLQEKNKERDKQRLRLIKPIIQAWKNLQLAFRQYVGKIERVVVEYNERRKKYEPREKRMKKREDVRVLLQEGQFALEQKKLDEAEKKFLAAIKLDGKNEEAYLGLGNVYFVQNHLSEAKEIFYFLLKINPNNEASVIKLAEISEEDGKKEEAIEYYQRAVLQQDSKPALFAHLSDLLQQINRNDTALEAVRQAVELEPCNPKYLDMQVELSVLCGDKKLAEETYQQLRMVNPENQKLAVLKDKIENMPS